MHLDFYTIVFFAIAVVFFVRLYGALGQKNGSERPPFRLPDDADDGAAGNDNIIPMPRAAEPVRRDASVPADAEARPEETTPDTPLSAALRAIASADRNFDPLRFVDGAKIAYEMIVTAYAKGDRKALKTLLSKEVMESFGRGLDEREKRGEKVDFTFVGLDRTEIVEAESADGVARVTVRFAAKVISVTHAADGAVTDGDASRLTDLVDVWTFARELKSSDPNWRLVETRAVA
ncbi:MAG: Tim44/TimA family putative adaptor protein [Hyphomicrobiales bacterium]|nr:Tim44/TimA family putative adaptor protein [Hyphomicrobiales bacterium]